MIIIWLLSKVLEKQEFFLELDAAYLDIKRSVLQVNVATIMLIK